MKQINGYIYTKQMREMGLNNRKIKSMIMQGQIIKLKHGLYRNADMFLQDQNFFDVCFVMPYAVISGFSALAYYGLTTLIPQEVSVSIPKTRKASNIIFPPIKAIRQNIGKFNQNINTIKNGKYSFRIFDIEKVICDTIKDRKKMGTDTIKEVLQEYLKRKDKNMPKLYETAKRCKVFEELNELLTIMR